VLLRAFVVPCRVAARCRGALCSSCCYLRLLLFTACRCTVAACCCRCCCLSL
jgi:hypothetical protein